MVIIQISFNKNLIFNIYGILPLEHTSTITVEKFTNKNKRKLMEGESLILYVQ